jgi:plasmid stabilization system protein ParE
MDFTVVWTDPALATFEAAIRYLLDRNPPAAERVRLAILDRVGQLTQFPFLGPVYEPDPAGTRDRVRVVPHLLPCGRVRPTGRSADRLARLAIRTDVAGMRQVPVAL